MKIEIQDLVKIYPLSKLASATIKQSRIDSRIKIEEPKFEHLLFDIELMFRRKNLLRSVKALWKICDIESEPDELFNKIGIDNLLKGIEYRTKGLKANMIREGNYWSYLIAYDSYNLNFPSSTLGHFYDAGEVFAYSNNQETFVGSKYYNFLESLNAKNPNLTLQEIIKYLEISDEISAYRNKATNNELKEYLISPIFLLLKEDLRKESELSKTKLNKKDYLLKVGGENFKAALVLLAAFFGFDKFYDAYYDKMNLRFFTAFRETKPSKKEEENRQEMVKKEIPKEKVEESISVANVLSLTINPVEMKTVSEPVNDYHQIILSALKSKGSCSLTDLAKELKAKKGKGKITKEDVRLILKDLEGIEIFKEKSTDKVRISTSPLFEFKNI